MNGRFMLVETLCKDQKEKMDEVDWTRRDAILMNRDFVVDPKGRKPHGPTLKNTYFLFENNKLIDC